MAYLNTNINRRSVASGVRDGFVSARDLQVSLGLFSNVGLFEYRGRPPATKVTDAGLEVGRRDFGQRTFQLSASYRAIRLEMPPAA